MYRSEQKMYDQLRILKESCNIQGVKAEFEAEGSSLRDLFRLRRITSLLGVKLFLKIGGPEAIRDIKDSLEIGVDGLIAPMVESKFGAKKFVDAFTEIYQGSPVHTALNVETETGIRNIEEIVNFSRGHIDSITIGRSDLSSSYFNNISVESDFLYTAISDISDFIVESGIELTVGGGVTLSTVSNLRGQYEHLLKNNSRLETRKVVFNAPDLIACPECVNHALKFEEIYIISKKEFSDIMINSEISRLTELNRRIFS